MRRLGLLVAVILVAALGCVIPLGSPILGSGFTPYSSSSVRPPLVTRALVAYQGDLPALQSAGAVPIGGVAVEADGAASLAQIESTAGTLAAQYGGTHIVFGGASDRVSIDGEGSHAEAYTSGHYEYWVYQVPAEGWAALPPVLNPLSFSAPSSPEP